MITEEQLADLFTATAAEIAVPADGAARIHALVTALPAQPTGQVRALHAAPADRSLGRRRRATWIPTAAAVAGLVALGVALGTHLHTPKSTATAGVVSSGTLGPENAHGAPLPSVATSAPAQPSSPSLDAGANSRSDFDDSPQAASVAGSVARAGALTIEVPSAAIGPTLTAIEQLARRVGGSVTVLPTPTDVTSATRTLTLRVPAGQLSAVTADLSGTRYGQELSSTATSTDVAGRQAELVSQLAILQLRRAEDLAVLARAVASPTTLAAEKQLASLDQQLARIASQSAQLQSDVQGATLRVTVLALPTTEPSP